MCACVCLELSKSSGPPIRWIIFWTACKTFEFIVYVHEEFFFSYKMYIVHLQHLVVVRGTASQRATQGDLLEQSILDHNTVFSTCTVDIYIYIIPLKNKVTKCFTIKISNKSN